MKGIFCQSVFALAFFFLPILCLSQNTVVCALDKLPSIVFKKGEPCADQFNLKVVDKIAEMVIDNPECKMAIISYGGMNKVAQQLSWDRVNQIVNYLVEKKGIRQERLIFRYGESGEDSEIVDFMPTMEDGPSYVPAPIPALSRLMKVRSRKCSY